MLGNLHVSTFCSNQCLDAVNICLRLTQNEQLHVNKNIVIFNKLINSIHFLHHNSGCMTATANLQMWFSIQAKKQIKTESVPDFNCNHVNGSFASNHDSALFHICVWHAYSLNINSLISLKLRFVAQIKTKGSFPHQKFKHKNETV